MQNRELKKKFSEVDKIVNKVKEKKSISDSELRIISNAVKNGYVVDINIGLLSSQFNHHIAIIKSHWVRLSKKEGFVNNFDIKDVENSNTSTLIGFENISFGLFSDITIAPVFKLDTGFKYYLKGYNFGTLND